MSPSLWLTVQWSMKCKQDIRGNGKFLYRTVFLFVGNFHNFKFFVSGLMNYNLTNCSYIKSNIYESSGLGGELWTLD